VLFLAMSDQNGKNFAECNAMHISQEGLVGCNTIEINQLM